MLVTLGSCLSRICIDHPISAAPVRQVRPAAGVEINRRMDPALRQQLRALYTGNPRLALSILDGSGTQVYTEPQVPVPERGMFIWDGNLTDLRS